MTDAPVDLEELKRLLAEGTQGAWKIERGKRCIQGPDTFEGDPLVITSIMGGSRQWSSSPYGEYCTTGMKEGDANAALIVAAVNSLAALIARVEVLELLLAEAQPLVAAMEFLDSRAYHYGRSYDDPSPAEWGISVDYQETRDMNPGAQFDADITKFHADNYAEDDPEEPGKFLTRANTIALALKGSA